MHLPTTTTAAIILSVLAHSAISLPCHEQQADQTILEAPIPTTTTRVTTSEHVFFNTNANSGLYLCENALFRGYCVHYASPFGQCTTITDQFPPGDRGVSAAGSDRGSWCTLYSESGCHGQELQIHFPGYENLAYLGWNDRAKSFNCAAE
ncbi:hypothetical protein ASPACDRAFT_40980 [Aspergillus aculeatus ATCC 16872]|uniref:Beta/gamma crystallin 'Greek key' domain-containing protein n=1 Tax=Aspergillus aculeatus (strain ATCC 16872 / CBS 172.66 / WB 5094) TaxID=690307 RepID=A0A1L9X0W4_ASPA1|nr:uncharacterized protein ASPACDRAFT_40980 [Aspergillus aculeatus ATCC 16872]OJK02162.1 hypothetical protein ASPACDRAFT_40980 [Aspergillus aculeatus ATCC 16872]